MVGIHEGYGGILRKQKSEDIAREIPDLVELKPTRLNDGNLDQASQEDIEKVNFKIALKEEIVDGLVGIRFGSEADLESIDEKSKHAIFEKAEEITLWAMPLYESGKKFNIEGKGQGLAQTYFEGGVPTL